MSAQRGQHIEHHANPGGILAQKLTTRLIGIDDGIGIGQLLTRQVMVGDHNLHPQLTRHPHTVEGSNAVVHGHQQIRQRAILLQPMEDARGQAIAVGKPAGHSEVHLVQPQHRQPQHRHRGTGGAIGVKITEDYHRLLLTDGLRK